VKHYSCTAQLIAGMLPVCMEEEEEEEMEKGEEEEEDEDEEELSGDPSYDALFRTLNEHGDTAIFPPLDGAAFYLNICKINHSCEPNVRVEYTEEDGAGVENRARALIASVRILRPIAEGEELVQSYIDENLSFEERSQALLDYGFACSCDKCRRQE